MNVRDLPAPLDVATDLNASLERHFWRWAALFLLVFLACSIAIDLRIKMWMDELFTLYVAKQDGLSGIIRAIIEGCDGSPPIYAMIAQKILPLTAHEELAVRLPATIGFGCMLACVLAFCRRRLPAAYAWIAALLACDGCLYYATDARPYGVVLGCAAAALLFWQLAIDGVRRPLTVMLLAVSLALMVAMHYYAIFFLAPILAGEIWRANAARSLDVGILAATLPACFVLALHYRLIEASKPFQAHFWSPASWRMIEPFYGSHLLPMLDICSVALIVLALRRKSAVQPAHPMSSMRGHEWVAFISLALMPPFVIGLSKYTTHAFADRYLVWVVMGFAILVTALLYRAIGKHDIVALPILAILLLLIGRQERVGLTSPALLREHPTLAEALESLPDGPEKIIVADPHAFLELAHYAEPWLRRRLIYAASPDLDVRYLGYDTPTLSLMALAHRSDLHVISYDSLRTQYKRFLLAVTPNDYLNWHLAASGYLVTPVSRASIQAPIFAVKAPESK